MNGRAGVEEKTPNESDDDGLEEIVNGHAVAARVI